MSHPQSHPPSHRATISRTDAIEQNLSKYRTGKMCKNGHTGERWTKNYACVECQKEWSLNYNHNNMDKMRARVAKWKEDNHEWCVEYARNRYQAIKTTISTIEP